MGNGIGDGGEIGGGANFVLKVAGQVDVVAGGYAQRFHIVGVHKNHAAAVGDAAVDVVGAVDGGVELVVGADGHHDEVAVREGEVGEGVGGEGGFFGGGV